MVFSLKDPRVPIFYVTVSVLFVISLGSIVIGAMTVRSQRNAAPEAKASDVAVALTAFGTTALFASIALFVAYLVSTWDDGNWLSKFVDKVRGVPKKFRDQKAALLVKRRRYRFQQLIKQTKKGYEKLSPKERSFFSAVINEAETPEAVAAEIQANDTLTDEQKDNLIDVVQNVEKEAKKQASDDVKKEEEKAIALPPPPSTIPGGAIPGVTGEKSSLVPKQSVASESSSSSFGKHNAPPPLPKWSKK